MILTFIFDSYCANNKNVREKYVYLQKRAKGQILLDLVFQHLELIEKDYFGLQYIENGVNATIPTSDVMVIYKNMIYKDIIVQ